MLNLLKQGENMRVFLIVIDSFGVGELPDADKYGDKGSNTFLNIYKNTKLSLPNLAKLGLYNIDGINIPNDFSIVGNYCKIREIAPAKDTSAGHYEIAGIVTKHPNPTYPNGFPKSVVKKLEKKCGCEFLGNCVASGTEIIKVLGEEHIKTGKPILYTSADSVLQIAAHVDVVPLERLYSICETARKVMKGRHNVGRIIARPFAGKVGEFYRTPDRRDYALKPPKKSMNDVLKNNGYEVIGVGKISDIFDGQGITEDNHTKTNPTSMDMVMKLSKRDFKGLCFANFVDTDQLYGHRNDVQGYANALMQIDAFVPGLIANLNNDDVLIITADHGCDPTTPSTDHSREYIPCLIYGKEFKQGQNMGTLYGFNNIADFVLKCFDLKKKSLIYSKITKDEK